MTVQAANRNNPHQYVPSGRSKLPGGGFESNKNPIEQNFDPNNQKYSSTSSATKLKAKFGQGRNCDINTNNKSSPIIYSKVHWLDRTDGGNIKSNAEKEGTNDNKSTKVEKCTVSFTPPTPRKKTGGIGLKWESQHSQEMSSSSLSSWKGNKNILSKSHSNIQELAIDDGRGFIPSEVAKDPNQKEFLINLSKRIFSNPGTKVIKEEMHRRRTEETNAENRKRSASAGRSAGLSKPSPTYINGKGERGRFQRSFKVLTSDN